MKKYIIIVRDYEYCCPSDEYLTALDRKFVSPVVKLDYERDKNKALDEFDARYQHHFSHFLHLHYELIPV